MTKGTCNLKLRVRVRMGDVKEILVRKIDLGVAAASPYFHEDVSVSYLYLMVAQRFLRRWIDCFPRE